MSKFDEVVQEIEAKIEEVDKAQVAFEKAKAELHATYLDKLGVDPDGKISILAVAQLAKKVQGME